MKPPPPPPTRAERIQDALFGLSLLAGLLLSIALLIACARVHVDAYLARTHPEQKEPRP